MSQSSYGAMLGSSSSPLPQSASFNSLHQHERMVTSPAVSPHSPPLGPGRWPNPRAPLTPLPAPSLQNYQLHSGELNGGLPSVSGFSSASTPYGVSSHTPPISGTDTMMGTCSPHSTPYCHAGSKLESPNIRAGGGVYLRACMLLIPFVSHGGQLHPAGYLEVGWEWMWALPSSRVGLGGARGLWVGDAVML